MEIIIVILVLFVLLALFGGAGYFFVRETGWDNARLWLTAPRQFRQRATKPQGSGQGSAVLDRDDFNGTSPYLDQPTDDHMPVRLDDSALRSLREELRGELTRAAGLTRDFDVRLTRMEADLSASRELPREIERTIQEQEKRVAQRISTLRSQLHTARTADSPFGQRRSDALADLYSHLAQVEAALGSVINPMLLPGEPLSVPDEFFEDTLQWGNWADVGDRAFAFGDIFNQTRFVLDPEIADEIEKFIQTFRQALTSDVYPVVQNSRRSPSQVAQMRSGLILIVESLPSLRRTLESAYRESGVMTMAGDDKEDDSEA